MGLPPAAIRDQLGDQVDWFAAALGRARSELLVVEPFHGASLPQADAFSVAVVTGSWAMVTDREDWSERTARWLKQMIEEGKPVLGICYGHQLMAHAMGGRVADLPSGPERGVFTVTLTDAGRHDPWLRDTLPSFPAYLSHMQSVLEPPVGARVLGGTARDPYQLLRYGPHAVSMQPHPEFTPTIMAACAAGRENGDSTLAGGQAAPSASSWWLPQPLALLRDFVAIHIGDGRQNAAL